MLVNESPASEVVSFRPSCESGNYSLETISYKFKLMVRMLIPMSSLGPKAFIAILEIENIRSQPL